MRTFAKRPDRGPQRCIRSSYLRHPWSIAKLFLTLRIFILSRLETGRIKTTNRPIVPPNPEQPSVDTEWKRAAYVAARWLKYSGDLKAYNV